MFKYCFYEKSNIYLIGFK